MFNWFTVPGAGLYLKTKRISQAISILYGMGLIILAGLHAVAALKHHFINRDITLRKMLTGASK